MRISDWSSDVCSSDLWQSRIAEIAGQGSVRKPVRLSTGRDGLQALLHLPLRRARAACAEPHLDPDQDRQLIARKGRPSGPALRASHISGDASMAKSLGPAKRKFYP